MDKFDPDAAPVLSVALTANKPTRDITEYADKVLRRQIESLDRRRPGARHRRAASARSTSGSTPNACASYNLTVTDVSRALQSQNIEMPGGRVDQGPQSISLRTRGRVQNVADFGDIVVREMNGHPVSVSDVARVEDGEADENTIANINGDRHRPAPDSPAVRHQHG